jgi:signal transduction histidine kinase
MRFVHRLAHVLAEAANRSIRDVRGLARFARKRVRDDPSAMQRDARFGGANDDQLAAVHERPRRGLSWPLRLLLMASLAVPILLLAFAAWQNLRLVRIQAEQHVTIATGQLHEHAVSALETYALVLAWIDDRISGLDWNQIEHDGGLHRFLADIETLPEIGRASIVDSAGRIRAGGQIFGAPFEDVSKSETFVAEEEQDAGIFISREHTDHRPGAPDFDISRRRSTSDGSFDGVIIVSAKPGYFSEFFSTVSRDENFSAALLRRDGTVLIRYPISPGALVFTPDRPVMQAIGAKPDHGLFRSRGATDGIERLFGYQRIGAYPLYVTFGIPTQGVFAAWWANLVNYLLFAVPASLALFCMTLFAVRQLQQQKVATGRWQTTARRLEREMDRRTLAEAELHQAQKLEALGQLTGGVAHDFNNLLTVLRGSLEMLSGRQSDPKLQTRVDAALGTIERAEKLTGQLLAFARRQPLSVARVDLNDLLQGMAELLTRTVGSRIDVTTDFAPDLWSVEVDTTQLELAVINLAINSRDAMPASGRLTVRTFNGALSRGAAADELSEGGEFVGLEISDTGAGMPPEVMARAFEPFFTTKGPSKGTGLGLSMVYGFARQSGGSAAIRSEVGHGTTVTLLLPRCK